MFFYNKRVRLDLTNFLNSLLLLVLKNDKPNVLIDEQSASKLKT